jgi:hypothetical protein
MITYKVSDLLRRSRQLADLEGSDFISWNEAVNCLNESYIGLYEKLIDMGDNSFVESFRTEEKEIELPKDFWQLKGVYKWNNGNLQTINRRADNAGIHFPSYELRNGKILIHGNIGELQIEYYKKPITLMFPPSDKEIYLDIPDGSVILGCCGHTFIYKGEDEQHNETLNVYDLDGLKTATDILETFDEQKTWINKDYVFTINGTSLVIYNLATGNTGTLENSLPLVSESGELFTICDGYICEIIFDGSNYGLSARKEIENAQGFYFVSDDEFETVYSIKTDSSINYLYQNGLTTGIQVERITFADGKCYYISNTKSGYYSEESDHTIKVGIGSPIGYVSINQNTGYGYCVKKYNRVWVCAYCEDVELNFPTSFYYQMLSYLLAISFKCKQGADISLLSSQLAMIEQTFTDTLGSDSYQFTRMGNVYN